MFFLYLNCSIIAHQGKRRLGGLACRMAGRMSRMNNHPTPTQLGRYTANWGVG
nr:MAG TPA: hypothetical protein [Caudoviricetes sp.]